MDCETCQPNLLDLAYGELAPDVAARSEAHLRECASCRSAFDKLQVGLRLARSLPRVGAPEEVGMRLVAMAEAKAAAAKTLAQSEPAPERGFFQPLIELVSRLAMARQVGMVTITVLIAVVGLVALPQLRPTPAMPVRQAPRAEAVPAAASPADDKTGLQPANRLDLHVDPQARRIRTKDDLTPALPPQRPAPAGRAIAEPQAQATARLRPATAENAEPLAEADSERPPEPLAAPSQPGEPSSASAEVASAKRADDLRDVGMVAERAPAAKAQKKSDAPMRAAAPEPFPASPGALAGEALGGGVAARLEKKRASAEAATASAADALATSEPSPRQDRSSAEGSAAPAPASPAQQRRAQLAAARQIEARGDCSAARPAYERVIAAGPSTDEAGSALIALALCARQHGDDATARALLERASKITTTSARARSLLRAPPKAKSSRPATQP